MREDVEFWCKSFGFCVRPLLSEERASTRYLVPGTFHDDLTAYPSAFTWSLWASNNYPGDPAPMI